MPFGSELSALTREAYPVRRPRNRNHTFTPLTMVSGELEETPDEHLKWMRQAMEMVCAYNHAEIRVLISRRRRP